MTAECKRISPDHIGPSCSCTGSACAIDARTPEQTALYWKQLEQAQKDVAAWPAFVREAFPQPR